MTFLTQLLGRFKSRPSSKPAASPAPVAEPLATEAAPAVVDPDAPAIDGD